MKKVPEERRVLGHTSSEGIVRTSMDRIFNRMNLEMVLRQEARHGMEELVVDIGCWKCGEYHCGRCSEFPPCHWCIDSKTQLQDLQSKLYDV